MTDDKGLKDLPYKAEHLLKDIHNSKFWKLSEPLRKLDDRARVKRNH